MAISETGVFFSTTSILRASPVLKNDKSEEIRDVVVGRLATSGGNLCVHICESQLQQPERRKANTAFSRSSELGESGEDVRGYEILPQAPERCHTMEDVGRWTRRCLLTSLSLKSVLNVSDVGGSSVSESLCVARPVLSSSALSSRTIWRHQFPLQSSFQTNYIHFATIIDIFIDKYVDIFIASHNILPFGLTGPPP